MRGNYLWLHYKNAIICFSLSSHHKTLTVRPEGLHSMAGIWSILFGREIVLLIAVHPLLNLSLEFFIPFLTFHILCFQLFHVVALCLFFCVLCQQPHLLQIKGWRFLCSCTEVLLVVLWAIYGKQEFMKSACSIPILLCLQQQGPGRKAQQIDPDFKSQSG